MAPTRRKARISLAMADASLGEMTWACWRRRGVTPPYFLLSLSRVWWVQDCLSHSGRRFRDPILGQARRGVPYREIITPGLRPVPTMLAWVNTTPRTIPSPDSAVESHIFSAYPTGVIFGLWPVRIKRNMTA